MDNTGITPLVVNEICALAEHYGVQLVVLFGSRARGDYQVVSDIDLAVKGGDVASFSLDVEEETSTLLQFDIVDLDQPVQSELIRSIEQEGRVIYEKV